MLFGDATAKGDNPMCGDRVQVWTKLAADGAYQTALKAYNTAPGLRFQRYETTLLRSFTGFPALTGSSKSNRLFELRTYESNSPATLRNKIEKDSAKPRHIRTVREFGYKFEP